MIPPTRDRVSSPIGRAGLQSRRLWWALITLNLILVCDAGSGAVLDEASAKPSQRVLVLYSDERLLPANIAIDEAIRGTFAASASNQVEFYSEFLDTARFPGEAQEQRRRDFFRNKYRERPPHLVITVSGAALIFAVKYRADLFAGALVVHCSAPGDPHPQDLRDASIAEVPVPDTAATTLELALRLHPDTRLVALVSGSSPRDMQLADGPRNEIPAFENRVAFTWLTNRSLVELRVDLSHLPDHSIVLYHTMFQDAEGRTLLPRQALAEFAPASHSPIYGYYDTYLGHGIVGGSMVTFGAIGRKTAQLAVWLWDIPRNRLWMSKHAKQVIGYPPDTELSLKMLSALVHTEDRAMREGTTKRALASTGEYDPKYRVPSSDGTVRWMAAHGPVEFSSAGKPIPIRCVSVDVTERRQVEQAMEHLPSRPAENEI